MRRYIRYAFMVIVAMFILPLPAFAAGTGPSDKVTVWEAFFVLLTVIPVSKMFSQIFMKLIVRQGVVNEEGLAGLGLGALGGLGGFLMLGKAVTQSFGKGKVPFPGKRFSSESPAPGGRHSPGGGSGSLGGPGGYSPGGSSGGTSPGRGSSGTGATPPGSGGSVPGSRSASGGSGGEGWDSTATGRPDPLIGPGSGFTMTEVGGSRDSGGAAAAGAVPPDDLYDEPDDRYRPGASSSLERHPDDPMSFDEVLQRTGQTSDKAGEVAGAMGLLGSLGVPEVAPVASGIAAVVTKGVTSGVGTFGKTTIELIKHTKLHKGNFKEALKAMAQEENVGRAAAKVGTGVAMSFLGARAGHSGAKHASNLVGKAQKAYGRVDSRIRYR